MLDRAPERPIPDPVYSICWAFDQGEFDHGDGLDPVSAHTLPMLNDILRDRRGILPLWSPSALPLWASGVAVRGRA